LRDSNAKAINVVLGDARIRLANAPACYYKLIVLDAFSFDTVPVHLLSREALKLCRDKLAEKGLLVLNLSNWYLDLDPVIGRQASDGGPACRVRYDLHVSDKERRLG
jgi:spermidine synthase